MRDMSLKARLSKLDKLIKLLPQTIEVSSHAVGAKHDVVVLSQAMAHGRGCL